MTQDGPRRTSPAKSNRHAKVVLAMLRGALDRDPAVATDRKRLREVKAVPMDELCGFTPSRFRSSSRPTRARSRSRPNSAASAAGAGES
jgi:hypothetical protein